MDEYYCPNCNAVLNDQFGFDPDKGFWFFTECGQELYGENIYSGELYDGVIWHCDGCGAILNKQSGFSDYCSIWYCTECGHGNVIDEDHIVDSDKDDEDDWSNEDEDEDEDEGEDEGEDEDEDDEDDDEPYRYSSSSSSDQGTISISPIASLKILLSLIILMAVIFAGYSIYNAIDLRVNPRIKVNELSYKDFRNQYMDNVAATLSDEGFRDVQLLPDKSLNMRDKNKRGNVTRVIIDGDSSWSGSRYFRANDKVIITYLEYGDNCEVDAPESDHKPYIGENYKKIEVLLIDCGFTDVLPVPLQDLQRDDSKAGTVEKVTINGDTKWSYGLFNSLRSKYHRKDPVRIYYHSVIE